MLRFRRASSLLLTIGAIVLLAACTQTPDGFLDDGIWTQGSARISNVSFNRGSLVATGLLEALRFDEGEEPILTITLIARADKVLCQNRGGNFPPGQNRDRDRAMDVESIASIVLDFSGGLPTLPLAFEVVAPDPLTAVEAGCPNRRWTAVPDWSEAVIVVSTEEEGTGNPIDLVKDEYTVECGTEEGAECESENLNPVPTCFGQEATVYVDRNTGLIVGGFNDGKVYVPFGTSLKGSIGPDDDRDIDDVIVGTDDNDMILAYGGDDLICALDGNDRIYGAQGFADIIDAGPGHDYIHDLWGNVGIYGGPGDDEIHLTFTEGWPETEFGGTELLAQANVEDAQEFSVYRGYLFAGTGNDKVSIFNGTGLTMNIAIDGDEAESSAQDGDADCYDLLGDVFGGENYGDVETDDFELSTCDVAS